MKYSHFTRRIAGDGSAAWDIHYQAVALKAQGEDVIVWTVGDPDFDTPAEIVESAVTSLRAGHTHYSDYRGEIDLRETIAARHFETTGQQVSPDQVVVQAGAQCALYSVAQCLLDPGDEIIVPEPMYVTYEGFLGAAGATIVNVPLLPEDRFHLRPETIADAVTTKTRAVLINSPHNPTGASLSREVWEAVATTCKTHDLWLIVDEVYGSLVFEGEHFNPCSLPGMAERTVTINSLSKSHAMTGWRLGWMIGPRELAEHVGNLTLCMLYGSPSFVQSAATFALSEDIPALEDMRAAYRQRRDVVFHRMKNAPGLQCILPEGGMFMMIDIRATGVSAQVFAQRLMDDFHVSVMAGEAFGPSAAGHVRCSLGLEESELLRGTERIIACAAMLMEE
jgi:arginine:pyruvate transaminase